VKEMKLAGKPVAQIARATGLSRPTVYRLLGRQSHP
jgi:DNA-binding phage protein